MKLRIYKALIFAWLASPYDSHEAWILDNELHMMELADPSLLKTFFTYGN